MDACMDEKGVVTHELYMTILGLRILDLVDVWMR
jgi:hypothetical protein